RHTRSKRDWSSDVCSSDLTKLLSLLVPPLAIGITWSISNGPFLVPQYTQVKLSLCKMYGLKLLILPSLTTQELSTLYHSPGFLKIGRASCRERVYVRVGGA